MLSEFQLITRYFTRPLLKTDDIVLGIGDDCALLKILSGMQLAISTDMLVEGKHFFKNINPAILGRQSLAVNLSDLAAMGAQPVAFMLALALPTANKKWLTLFSKSLLKLADEYNCKLIGGDTTKGPLTINITIFGTVPHGQALRRDVAKVGDDIWVSGTIGDARLALAIYRKEIHIKKTHNNILQINLPIIPRIKLGIALRGIAHAAIDISDGLAGDLIHILESSNVGALLYVDSLPISSILRQQSLIIRRNFTLSGGDDYELCFTSPVKQRKKVIAAAMHSATTITRVGIIEATPGLRLIDTNDKLLNIDITTFDHFKTEK